MERLPAPPNTKFNRSLIVISIALTCVHLGYVLFKKSAILLYFPPPDLKSFYWGAQAAFVEHSSPYSVHYLKLLADGHVFPYLYPPTSLLLFSPLSAISFQQAHLGLLALNHLLIPIISLTLVLLFTKPLKNGPQRLFSFILVLNLLLLFAPTHGTFALGQINLIVLTFILLFILSLQKESPPFLSASLLLVPVVLKTYPALIVFYLLVRRRFLLVLWLALLFSCLFIASLFILPEGLWMNWILEILPAGNYGGVPEGLNAATAPSNQNINAFIHRSLKNLDQRNMSPIASNLMVNGFAYGLSLLIFIVSLWTCNHARKQHFKNHLIECGVFLLVMLMVAPLTWDHHFLFFIPAFLGCVLASIDNPAQNVTRLISLIIIGLVVSLKFKLYSPFFSQGWGYLLVSSKLFMVFWLWMISIRIIYEKGNQRCQEHGIEEGIEHDLKQGLEKSYKSASK